MARPSNVKPSPHVIKSLEELREATASNRISVIVFTHPDSKRSKEIKEKLKKLAEEFPDVDIYLVDTSTNPEAREWYNITSVPTFVIEKGGEPLGEVKGPDIDKLRETLDELLARLEHHHHHH
uniref:E_1r26 n=1 Tax=Escherichia coli TaxID=562 RepID=UPI000877AF7B|nr:Chain A, E_1r26 [Escherichia coli]